MAWFLAPNDYGLYAIALGITTFTTVMRGGGTGVVFQTLKLDEFGTIGGGLVRVAFACGLLGTIFTLAMVLPAPYLYPQDSTKGLGWLLFWIALEFVRFNITTYPRAKVLSRLMFKHIAAMDTASALMKFGSAYYFAANGYGALSFILSQFVSGIVVFLWSLTVAGMQWSDFKASPQWLPETYAMLKIPFAMALITSLGSQSDLFFFSFFIPVGALGVYLFTNQIAVQPVQMLSGTLQSVLAPYASHVRGDLQRENNSVRQTFFTGVIFVPLFIMGIAAVYPNLAHLFFADKWNESILPVQFACVFLIFPTVQTLLEAPLMGARRWNITLELFIGRMIGKLVGAILGLSIILTAKLIQPIPEEYYALTLVICVGLTSSLIAFYQIRKVSKQIQISPDTFRYEIYSTPLYAVLAAIATAGLASSIIDLIDVPSTSLRTKALIEFLISSLMYGGVCCVLLRFGYTDNLHNLLQLLPRYLRQFIYNAFALKPKSRSSFQADK